MLGQVSQLVVSRGGGAVGKLMMDPGFWDMVDTLIKLVVQRFVTQQRIVCRGF